MTIECEISGCGETAYLEIRWSGPSKQMQTGKLCKQHVRDLWDRMRGLVATGMGTWTNLPIPCDGEPVAR